MEELPRQRLAELIGKYGRGLVDDPRRTEALLRDVCGPHRREVNVLVGALREGIPSELLGSKANLPAAVQFGRLTQRLDENLGMAHDAAQWAVESWALALGIVSANELAPTVHVPPASPRAQGDLAQAAKRSAAETAVSRPPVSGIKQTLIVSKSPGEGFGTVGEAFAAATNGSTILIRPGIYRVGIQAFDDQKQLLIKGDGPKDQIILEGVPALRVWGGSIAVSGLTFRRPTLPATEDKPYAAVEVSQSGALTLEECAVVSEEPRGTLVHAGGVFNMRRCNIRGGLVGINTSGDSAITIEDCAISNVADRGIDVTSGTPHFQRCNVESDSQGMIFMTDAGGLIEDCEIHSRGKIGVAVIHHSNPTIRRCRVRADNGPAISFQHESNGTVEETTITGPRGYFALHLAGNAPSIRNSRVEGGAIFMDGCTGSLEDCTVVSETFAIQAKGGSRASIRRSTIQGKAAGVSIRESSTGIVENCDLRGSKRAWDIERGSTLTKTGNRE